MDYLKTPRNRITFDIDCHINIFLQLHIAIHKARDHITSAPSLKLHQSHTHHLQQPWLKNHNAIWGLPKGPSPHTISYSEMVPEISCDFHGAQTFCWDATPIVHLNESPLHKWFVPQLLHWVRPCCQAITPCTSGSGFSSQGVMPQQ
jgi:hypothetical protein